MAKKKNGLVLVRPAAGGKQHMVDETTGKTLCGRKIVAGKPPMVRATTLSCERCYTLYRVLGGSVLTLAADTAERSKSAATA